MPQDRNNVIRRGLNKVNGMLARHYSRAAVRDSNEAVRHSTGARNAAHGSTMAWGGMRNPESMRRDQRNVAQTRAAASRESAASSNRNARRSRAAASRVR